MLSLVFLLREKWVLPSGMLSFGHWEMRANSEQARPRGYLRGEK